MRDQRQPADIVCCLYPTVPLLSSGWLSSGYERLLANPFLDYVSAAGLYRTPVMRALKGASGGVAILFPEHAMTRSQDLPPVYHDAGESYWGRAEAWLNGRPVFSPKAAMIQLPHYRVVDIYNEADWQIAELFAQVVEEAGLE